MATQFDVSTLSVQDVLDMAVMIEKEAEERYLLFAEQIGGRYPGDAATFFKMMAQNEKKHGVELAERRRKLFGDAPVIIGHLMKGKEVEAPAMDKAVPYMTPRQALEVALESETKAYEFYVRVLTNDIRDPEVRALIEELRDEEVEHQRLLNEMKTRYPDTSKTDYDPDIDGLNSYHQIT